MKGIIKNTYWEDILDTDKMRSFCEFVENELIDDIFYQGGNQQDIERVQENIGKNLLIWYSGIVLELQKNENFLLLLESVCLGKINYEKVYIPFIRIIGKEEFHKIDQKYIFSQAYMCICSHILNNIFEKIKQENDQDPKGIKFWPWKYENFTQGENQILKITFKPGTNSQGYKMQLNIQIEKFEKDFIDANPKIDNKFKQIIEYLNINIFGKNEEAFPELLSQCFGSIENNQTYEISKEFEIEVNDENIELVQDYIGQLMSYLICYFCEKGEIFDVKVDIEKSFHTGIFIKISKKLNRKPNILS